MLSVVIFGGSSFPEGQVFELFITLEVCGARWKAEFAWMETHCCEFYFGGLKSHRMKDDACWYSEEGVCVCAEEVWGGGWLRMVLFVFSVRGKAADQRESFLVAREELGPGLPEGVLRTQVLLPAHRHFSGRGHTVDCHPYTQHADPCKAPAGRGNRLWGWPGGQKVRGAPECSLLTTLGLYVLNDWRNWGEKWVGE